MIVSEETLMNTPRTRSIALRQPAFAPQGFSVAMAFKGDELQLEKDKHSRLRSLKSYNETRQKQPSRSPGLICHSLWPKQGARLHHTDG